MSQLNACSFPSALPVWVNEDSILPVAQAKMPEVILKSSLSLPTSKLSENTFGPIFKIDPGSDYLLLPLLFASSKPPSLRP